MKCDARVQGGAEGPVGDELKPVCSEEEPLDQIIVNSCYCEVKQAQGDDTVPLQNSRKVTQSAKMAAETPPADTKHCWEAQRQRQKHSDQVQSHIKQPQRDSNCVYRDTRHITAEIKHSLTWK